MRILLALALVAWAGCTDVPDGPGPAVVPGVEPAAAPNGSAPAWHPGQSWTYRTAGHWDTSDEVTVVAVPMNGGWLLAGAGPDDLIDEIAWDHPLFGPVDLAAKAGVYLSFPLEEGATWTLYGQEMVVEVDNITWSGGRDQGFRAREPDSGLLVEYVPEAGYLTRYESRADGELEFGLELVATGTASTWTYLERLAEDIASGGTAQATLDVPAAADEVLAWMLSSDGATNFVAQPAQAPSTFEGQGGRNFHVERFAGAQGTWAFGGAAVDGDTYMQLHAVAWVEGEIANG